MTSSGQLLADRYRLTKRIAVGGMGEVWEAADTRLDRTVAVKILKAELSTDAEFLHRFRTEARTTASLNHPGIAAVHDYGEAAADGESLAYLVMELVEGEPLAGILVREGRVTPDRLLPILEQAARALHAAHERGLVHRDVKPGNILVARSADGTDLVKITDFGIAKAGDAAPVTRNGMVMGTAHYIAPEQATGAEASPASDVYSLAVCGYECLAGHRPFLSENAVTVAMMHIRDAPPPLPADVPPNVRTLIEATLIKDPKQRYADGGEFAAAVAAVRAGHNPPPPAGITHTPPGGTAVMPPPTAAAPVAPVPPPTQAYEQPATTSSRSNALWVAVAVLALALIAAAGVGLALMNRSDDSDTRTPPSSTRQQAPSTTPSSDAGQQPATPSSEKPSVTSEKTTTTPPPTTTTTEQKPPESTSQQTPTTAPSVTSSAAGSTSTPAGVFGPAANLNAGSGVTSGGATPA